MEEGGKMPVERFWLVGGRKKRLERGRREGSRQKTRTVTVPNIIQISVKHIHTVFENSAFVL